MANAELSSFIEKELEQQTADNGDMHAGVPHEQTIMQRTRHYVGTHKKEIYYVFSYTLFAVLVVFLLYVLFVFTQHGRDRSILSTIT